MENKPGIDMEDMGMATPEDEKKSGPEFKIVEGRIEGQDEEAQEICRMIEEIMGGDESLVGREAEVVIMNLNDHPAVINRVREIHKGVTDLENSDDEDKDTKLKALRQEFKDLTYNYM